MAVPNIFGSATSAIPLSQLDTNFATPVTIGNTAVQLGNTVTSFGNVTLTNVTISSGNVTLTGANVSGTANVSTLVVTGNATIAGTATTIQGLTVGKGAGAGSANTALGVNALTSAAGSNFNTALGYQSGYSTSTGNGANSFVGYQSGYAVTTGESNTFLGTNSAKATTTGAFNVAIGKDSLQANTTASNNTAVGYQAGYSNVAGGAGFGKNTFVGNEAGYAATGYRNVFYGHRSGYLVTTGNSNTIIGGFDGNTGGLDIRTASNYIVLSDGDGNPRLWVTNGPFLFCPAVYADTAVASANVGVLSTGEIYRTTSSLKYKNNVLDATHGLADVMKLRPVTYKSKRESENNLTYGGLIAEEVHAAGLTEFVAYADDGTPDALHYSNMVSLAFKAIQELKAEVDSLKSQLNGASA